MKNNIGLKIKEIREAKGFNYNQLAELAGISNRMVSMIESGQNCSIEILTKIAKALGKPPAYFLK